MPLRIEWSEIPKLPVMKGYCYICKEIWRKKIEFVITFITFMFCYNVTKESRKVPLHNYYIFLYN